MPKLTNIDGIASFSEKGMDIDIISAKTLNSEVTTGKISIKDFQDPNLNLKN